MKKTKKREREILTDFIMRKIFRFFMKWVFPCLLILLSIVGFLVIKVQWNLSFGWESPELGILLGILLLGSWIMLKVEKKKNPHE